MNISSTPFIRNDYWPDYNDINQLNQRINEVENELSLTNIRLSADIENVSNNLNSYADNQANTTIANNIIVNNINANYAVGKFVNFGNANFNNAYVENLTVNKPVFDITLNTPHIENVTSLGGNIYDANMFNVNITGGDVAFNNVSVDDLNAANATISNVNILNGDVNLNSAVIGDLTVTNASISNVDILDGNVNLNKAIIDDLTAVNASISNVNILDGNVNLNKAIINNVSASNATVSNLFVNTQPEPVTSSAVLGYDSEGRVIPVHASFDVGFPEDANYLYTDHAGTAFAGTAATEVSAINNLITAQAVQNGFNDINANVQNGFNDINANVQNGFNDTNTYIHSLEQLVAALIPSSSYSNAIYWNVSHASLPNTFKGIRYTTPEDNTGYNISEGSINPVYAKVNGDYLEFSSNLPVTDIFAQRIFNTNMSKIFDNCRSLNQNIQIPNSVTNMARAFNGCKSLNQNIQIPSGVTNMYGTFSGCSNLNQNIQIPSSVTSMGSVFSYCSNLNQNIQIPSGVTSMFSTFARCSNLNQNIQIPSGVTNMYGTFSGCSNLNQNIQIPSGVTDMASTFMNCASLNQNILIPNTVDLIGDISGKLVVGLFAYCVSLNQPIAIPNSVEYMILTFKDCTSLNQDDMYIYSQNITDMTDAYNGVQHIGNIHIPTSVPKDTSNFMYNCLVNGNTGYTFASENIINDLPVDIAQWPPV